MDFTTDDIELFQSAKLTSISMGGTGNADPVTPICPRCEEELVAESVSGIGGWVVGCGCDDPPERFEIEFKQED